MRVSTQIKINKVVAVLVMGMLLGPQVVGTIVDAIRPDEAQAYVEDEVPLQIQQITKTVYEIAGEQHKVSPYILEAIHSIETTASSYLPFKRGETGYTCIVSSAGAKGPFQFMPLTWQAYGSGDICSVGDSAMSASRYLRANYDVSGSWQKALWQYNHSDHYVNNVIQTAINLKHEI